MESSSNNQNKVAEALLSPYQTFAGVSNPPALTSLYARYDGEKIQFAIPFALRPGDHLIITVLPQEEELAEREDWFALSAAGLAEAYGDNEPEYTLAHIKERNPDYAGG